MTIISPKLQLIVADACSTANTEAGIDYETQAINSFREEGCESIPPNWFFETVTGLGTRTEDDLASAGWRKDGRDFVVLKRGRARTSDDGWGKAQYKEGFLIELRDGFPVLIIENHLHPVIYEIPKGKNVEGKRSIAFSASSESLEKTLLQKLNAWRRDVPTPEPIVQLLIPDSSWMKPRARCSNEAVWMLRSEAKEVWERFIEQVRPLIE